MNNQNTTDSDTTTVTDDMLETELNEVSFKNGPSVVWNFFTGSARDILEMSQDKLQSFKNWLIVTMVVPVVLLIIGVAVAANSDHVAGVHFGQGVITVAGFLATLFCGMFLLRARIYAYIFLGASRAARIALRFMPTLDTEEVRKYVQYFSGIWAWIAGVCLYAQIIPIYRNVGTALMVATAMLALAAIMAAGWFGGQRAQKILLGIVVVTLVVSTVRLSSPRFLNGMEQAQDFALGTDGRTDADRALIRQFKAEHDAIRAHAATDCGGIYCSDADRAKVLKLEENIHDLETGQYWTKLESNSNDSAPRSEVKAKAASAQTEAAPATTETEDAPKAAQKTETRPAQVKAKHAAKVREAFAELDQFQDIVGK